MSWTPRHGHVTQLHSNGSGQSDCWPASLTRYLRERLPPTLPADDMALINAIDLITHDGVPDNPNNPDTTLAEASTSLQHYNIPIAWTNSYQAALNAPWSILLVDGTALRPANYPPGWFSDPGQANHFILWLPQWKGSANWFNDPLVPQNQDVQYDLDSVASAFSGAYLLPTTGNGETGPIHTSVIRACGLKAAPNHTSVALAHIPGAGQIIDFNTHSTVAGEQWGRVQWRDMSGFVLASNIKAAA